MFKTGGYLLRALVGSGRRPYTVAIASYAMVLLHKTKGISPVPFLMRAAAPGEPRRSFSFSLPRVSSDLF